MNELSAMRDYSRELVLDCETPDIARSSIASILGIPKDELTEFLRAYKFNPEEDVERLLESILKDKKSVWGFSSTAWFHLTRCKTSETFQDGLLPFPDIIEQTWKYLFKIQSYVSKAVWDEFKVRIENSEVYRIRMNNRGLGQHGPYGTLIGDFDFNVKINQEHYLRKGPEIIIYICNEFFKQYGHNLQNNYIGETSPCIIKFETMGVLAELCQSC